MNSEINTKLNDTSSSLNFEDADAEGEPDKMTSVDRNEILKESSRKKKKKKKKTIRESKIKWVMLFLISFYVTGNYYCLDNPAALQSSLMK